MRNLLDVYKDVLATAGMSADEDGFVSKQLAATKKKPAVVKDKRLVLPTDAQLRNPDFSNRVVFHPLSESILRGESEVLTYFRESFMQRLNFIIGYTSICLLDLACSTAKHRELSPEQTEFLLRVREADSDTVERVKKITSEMLVGDATRSFVHIRVQKNGSVKGVKHRRVGVVYFPFYEEIKKVPAPKHPNEIYGVKLRKSDREVLTALMEYIIPGLDKPEEWMFASDSEIAPTLEALMKCIIAVGDPVNSVVELFKDHIEASDDMGINGDWEEDFKDLNALLPQIRLIPMQPGNEGRVPPTSGNVLTIEGAPVASPAAAPAAAAPRTLGQPAPAAAVKRPTGGLAAMSIDDKAGAPTGPQPHPMAPTPGVPYNQPAQPTWAQPQQPAMGYPAAASGYPQPMQPQMQPMAQVQMVMTPQGPVPMVMNQQGVLVPVAQPGYPAAQPTYGQPQQPALRHSARGLDFTSVLQANPAMAAAVAPQAQYYGTPQPNTPGWARPQGFGNI